MENDLRYYKKLAQTTQKRANNSFDLMLKAIEHLPKEKQTAILDEYHRQIKAGKLDMSKLIELCQ